MNVVPGLYMADCTQRARAWLLADGITCVLFDTGGPDGTLGVGELLQSAGRKPYEVRLVLLTHAHRGHAGNVAEVGELTGASIGASGAVASAIAAPPAPPHRHFDRLRAAAAPRPAHVAHVLEPGEVLDIAGGIEVIDAPGHAPGAVAYHLRGPDALIVGDAVEVRRGRLRPPPLRQCADPDIAAQTAARLIERSAAVVAPGHGYALVGGRRPSATVEHIRWRDGADLIRRR